MAKDPVVTIDQIIKNLAPKVQQVVKEHSALLWRQVLTRHLTGGTSPDRLGRRTGTMARATRPIPVKMEGSKVTGGLSFGAEYAWTHVGPSGSKVTIRPKNKKFLAIPLAAAGDGSATEMLLYGKINAAAKFPTLTVGAVCYISAASAGLIVAGATNATTGQPSGTDNVIRIVGWANTADELFFNPDQFYITHV